VSELEPTERSRLARILEAATVACWADLDSHPWRVREPSLGAEAIDALLAYLERLLLWRKRISLVATEAPEEIVTRHVVDALALAPFVAPAARLADVGSGAGFPGLPLAIVCPDVDVLLIEPRRKRANFLLDAIRAAGIANCRVVESRVEDLPAAQRAGVDLVVSRAFGPLGEFLAVAATTFQRADGIAAPVLVMKGPRGSEEAEALAERFGMPQFARYGLPGRDERMLLMYAGEALQR